MGRKKKYKNAAEKQRAWRIRTGKQKEKVPISIRRGEKLGTSEGVIRLKRPDETWEEYHNYIEARREKLDVKYKYVKIEKSDEEGMSIGASRGGVEPTMNEDYYEIRAQYEKDLYELEQKRRRKIGEKK